MYRTLLLVIGVSVVLALLATAVQAQSFYFRFGGGGLERYLYGPYYYYNPDTGYYSYRGFSRDPYLWNDWERRGVYGWYGAPQPYDRPSLRPWYNDRRDDWRDRDQNRWRPRDDYRDRGGRGGLRDRR